MKRRWWLLLVLFALVIAGARWYLQRPVEVQLPVLNRSDQPVQLLFYGAGLSGDVLVSELAPAGRVVVSLTLTGAGPVHVRAESERVRLDSLLVRSNAQLRGGPLQFEVRSGNQFVLVPL